MLKLSEPDLAVALQIAKNLGFDMALMSELLPASVQGIKAGMAEQEQNPVEKV